MIRSPLSLDLASANTTARPSAVLEVLGVTVTVAGSPTSTRICADALLPLPTPSCTAAAGSDSVSGPSPSGLTRKEYTEFGRPMNASTARSCTVPLLMTKSSAVRPLTDSENPTTTVMRASTPRNPLMPARMVTLGATPSTGRRVAVALWDGWSSTAATPFGPVMVPPLSSRLFATMSMPSVSWSPACTT